MDIHRHHVSGFFAQRNEAEATLALLVSRGLAREQLQIFDTSMSSTPPAASTPHQRAHPRLDPGLRRENGDGRPPGLNADST